MRANAKKDEEKTTKFTTFFTSSFHELLTPYSEHIAAKNIN
jgi:hypothetical protein